MNLTTDDDLDAFEGAEQIARAAGAGGMSAGWVCDHYPNRQTDTKRDRGHDCETRTWWTVIRFDDGTIRTANRATLAAAMDLVARTIINGRICPHCGKRTTALDLADTCQWYRVEGRWIPACTTTSPA